MGSEKQLPFQLCNWDEFIREVLCLVIVNVNVTKYDCAEKMSKMSIDDRDKCVPFVQALNIPKLVFGRGSAPAPLWGSLRRSPRPLVGWRGGHPPQEGNTLPIPFCPQRLQRLNFRAYTAPRLSGPQHKFLATRLRLWLSYPELVGSKACACACNSPINSLVLLLVLNTCHGALS